MSAAHSLYDDVILDHIKNARNYRVLERADRVAEGVNPLCGDNFTVYVQLDGEVIRDAAFQCSCCGISMASASVMTEAVKGRTLAQAAELYTRFTDLLSRPGVSETVDDLGEVAVLAVVRAFPSRRDCAALAWHTLLAALEGRKSMVLGSATTA
ncbi:MAG TPA: SUF system NifU family Fe-S cluster assembly protein [Burkholderiales bacterium]|nr:SUF system NifU family Fe-S cluster assembly protein [Burkholderiales bacterium]